MNIEFTKMVWEPNKRTSLSRLEFMVSQGFGSSWLTTFLLFWSKATVILIHSESKIKMGLVLYTNVDSSDSGDLGSKVNLEVVMVHFEISSKLMRPWYLAWNFLPGHCTKDSVGFWKNKKLKDPKLYLTLGAAIFKEQCWVWLNRRNTWHVGKWLIRLWHRKLLLKRSQPCLRSPWERKYFWCMGINLAGWQQFHPYTAHFDPCESMERWWTGKHPLPLPYRLLECSKEHTMMIL